MSKNYAVRVRCPYGDSEAWIILEDRNESLEDVLRSSWDFECEAHGVQHEFPLEATDNAADLARAAEAAKPAPPPAPERTPRFSDRQRIRVPVVVYGWSQSHGAFHEDTCTLVVNESGALVPVAAKVEIGDTMFLVNKITQEEEEVRVAYVEPEFEGTRCVGVAFKQPTSSFWRRTRQKTRIPKTMRVVVRGIDPNGHPYVHTAYTIDISQVGARLDGVGYLTKPGDTIEVKRRWRRKGRFRVIWIGQIGTQETNQVGLYCLETDKKNMWGVSLPEAEPEVGPSPTSPPPSKKRKSS